MTIEKDFPALGRSVIGQVMTTARYAIDKQQGYSATLLLLSAVDAISAWKSGKEQKGACLDILQGAPFLLNTAQVANVRLFFRHKLAHAGAMQEGVLLTPDSQGAAFGFNSQGELVEIRVGAFWRDVECIWRASASHFDPTPQMYGRKPALPASAPVGSASTTAASGMV